MNGLIIASTNKADLKLFTDLANRIGVSFKTLSNEDLLDIGLLKAMEEGKKTKFVSKERIMKKLNKNENKIS
ncbi:MAG: hypothetical protein IPL35_16855 [Sphingobacteriales bacterium]|nr:hypothetical protein [Sphingobacteriales bacterium]